MHTYNIGFQLQTFPSWTAFTARKEEENSTFTFFVKLTGEMVSGETSDGM